MKKTVVLLGLIAVLSSCNNSRIAELEAENMELKVMVERLTNEAKEAQMSAEKAQAQAMVAQKRAVGQAIAVQEAEKNVEK